jgi:hypothetical protein
MGCGCSGGTAAALKNVVKYSISDDPESKQYLTEREAINARTTRNLEGEVVPSAK